MPTVKQEFRSFLLSALKERIRMAKLHISAEWVNSSTTEVTLRTRRGKIILSCPYDSATTFICGIEYAKRRSFKL